jgi:hypothetical protein
VNDQLYALGGIYKDANGNIYSVNEQYTPIGYGTPEQFPSYPSPEPQQDTFPTTLVGIASGISVAVLGLGLLVYFKKRHVHVADRQ